MIKLSDSKYISTPLKMILEKVREDTYLRGDMFLKDIMQKPESFVVTCPFHADHNEKKPACTVFDNDKGTFTHGDFHCFVCGESGNLSKLVGKAFYRDEEFGRSWLWENFGDILEEREIYFPTLDLEKPKREEREYLDEKILDTFQPHHPYMDVRKLSPSVCEEYKVKYDPSTNSIIFPVWDKDGGLHMLTRRSVTGKTFIIDENKEKPVYLLSHMLKRGVPYVLVCESQINALTCLTHGIAAVATFGSNVTQSQIEELDKSGLSSIIIAFDGDEAGRRGARRLKSKLRKDKFIDIVELPDGKDINDLTKDEFKSLLTEQVIDYDTLNNLYNESIGGG